MKRKTIFIIGLAIVLGIMYFFFQPTEASAANCETYYRLGRPICIERRTVRRGDSYTKAKQRAVVRVVPNVQKKINRHTREIWRPSTAPSTRISTRSIRRSATYNRHEDEIEALKARIKEAIRKYNESRTR